MEKTLLSQGVFDLVAAVIFGFSPVQLKGAHGVLIWFGELLSGIKFYNFGKLVAAAQKIGADEQENIFFVIRGAVDKLIQKGQGKFADSFGSILVLVVIAGPHTAKKRMKRLLGIAVGRYLR